MLKNCTSRKAVIRTGSVYTFNCKCGYKKDLCLGTGRSARDIEQAARVFDTETFARFEEKSSPTGRNIIKNVPIRCKQCRGIFAVIALEFTRAEDGKPDQIVNNCPGCGNPRNPYKNIEKILCPECGRRLKVSETGHWS